MCISTTRKQISARKLGKLVDATLSQWTRAGKAFTAYDMTRTLRAQHPDLEIDHPLVRYLVWSGMSGHPDYDVEAWDYSGTLANTWYPTPVEELVPFFSIGGLIVWRN